MTDAKHHDGWHEHDEVWLLLPWYANGTLEAAERALVEEHLGGCASCKDELARCSGLAAAMAAGREAAPSPHPIQLARLMERVEASERSLDTLSEDHGPGGDSGHAGHAAHASHASHASDTGESEAAPAQAGEPAGRGPATASAAPEAAHAGRFTAAAGSAGQRRGGRAPLLVATPAPVRWALAAQMAALLLLSATLAFGPGRPGRTGQAGAAGSPASAPPARFVTLSAPSPAAVRPQIRLIFSEAATGKEIRDVLQRTRGRLVDGPSPIGAYILELPAPAERPAPAAPANPSNPPDAGGPQAASPTLAEASPAPLAPLAQSSPGARVTAHGEPAADSPGSILAYLHAQRIVRFAEPVAGAPWPAAAPAPITTSAPAAAGRSAPPAASRDFRTLQSPPP
jgi:hypothetical protein